ncbi:MAG: hypothetical protein HKP41_19225 [Desulfobacterales bacterium]|nr:hypothetical protein [Desulfobacterales bacterium]
MSLAEKLQKIREGAKERIPEEARLLMQKANKELGDSGILDKTLKVGDALPSFNLVNIKGEAVASSELLTEGNLVLTFYRGVW